MPPHRPQDMPQQAPPWFSIALLSMTALAYEILLMRLFSIIQWHHFAYMIISLALLGYGVSGTFLALTQGYLLPRYGRVYLIQIVLFALTSLLCFLLAQQLPFNAEEILWMPGQALHLLFIYLLLALPFLFVANAIGLTLIYHRSQTSLVYGADLAGAGIGSLLIVLLLFVFLPMEALRGITTLAFISLLVAGWELYGQRILGYLPLLLILIGLPFIVPSAWMQLHISPYKNLNQALRLDQARVVTEDSSPLGLITVVENPTIPFRYAPGLSLNASMAPAEQVALFIDADAMTVITRDTGKPQALAYLGQLTSALAYQLSSAKQVLVLGAGGGSEVLQARYYKASSITAVELDPKIIDLLRINYRDYSADLYNRPGIHVVAAEARGFVAASDQSYDLIQLALFDSFAASAAGLYALNENYLYTTEAIQLYLKHLQANGVLSISRWVKLPPRDSLKLFATAIEALREKGSRHPERQLMMIRGLQTSTLLIKNTPFSESDIQSLEIFCRQRGFDVIYYPGITADKVNRYNQLAEAEFYQGTQALLTEQRAEFIRDYKFNIQPATDDMPYFSQYFKWQSLTEIIRLIGQGGMPLLEWGYLILVATLLQAMLASVVLILLPLLAYRQSGLAISTRLKRQVLFYFMLLGLAFLLIEMVFIQKFILFLHHPVYALAVVLAAFLLFAGIGSLYARRWIAEAQYITGLRVSISLLSIIGLVYTLCLGPLLNYLIGWSIAAKIILSISLIAPLAFCMGMPFPLGLSRLGGLHPQLIPWAWAINGCASVISAVLASLLAIHFGFTLVVGLALVLYGLALFSARTWMRVA